MSMANTNQCGDTREALGQLDQAIHNHKEWFNAVTRTLVCRLPPDPKDVAPDAHCRCRLGRWYYGSPPGALRAHPGFIALGSEHQIMHQEAARLLQGSAAGTPVAPEEFDGLAKSLERVRAQLLTLKLELEDALHNLDPLTGVHSRVGMLTKLREQHDLVTRQVQSSCVVMLDVDKFKEVNDTYGHPVGDKALTMIAHYLSTRLRPYDKLFRYGGEEFLICMPGTDAATGHMVVERARRGLAETAIDYEGQAPLHVTVSFGVTPLDPDVSVEKTIARADKALYAAKAAGRNCVRAWDPSMGEL